jgi:hypothetical protein
MRPFHWIVIAVLAWPAAGCGDRTGDGGARAMEQAAETSRLIAQAEWQYDREIRPPERGDTEPVEEDRCRITLPGQDAPRDVVCGIFFMALEPHADSAWIDQMVHSLGGEVIERRQLPGWATRLDHPVPYVLVQVPLGEEPRAIQRALASEGVRFVDVRRIQRRRP